MKSTFIPTILLLLISIDYSFAQNTFPSSGSVGIGTTNPIEPLEVNGNIIADGLISTRVPSNGNTWFQAATNGTLATGIGSNTSPTTNAYGAPSNSSFVGNAQGYPLVFTTSAVEHMRITTGGNVGIGTTNPGAVLDIFGNSNTASNLILSANYIDKYRWRFNTIDRGNAIDMDITASNFNDAQETILKLSPIR